MPRARKKQTQSNTDRQTGRDSDRRADGQAGRQRPNERRPTGRIQAHNGLSARVPEYQRNRKNSMKRKEEQEPRGQTEHKPQTGILHTVSI